MNTILLTILEDASSAPFQPEDFLSKIFGNFWSLLINLLALLVLFLVLFFLAYKPIRKYSEKRRDYIEGNISKAEEAKRFYEHKVTQTQDIIDSAQKKPKKSFKKQKKTLKKKPA